jgi:hypothetical protein
VDEKLLSIYLQDHMAGAVAGVELARRARGSNRDTDYGEEIAEICATIEEHRQVLQDVAGALGISPSRVKEAPAWVGEKLGRLKLNGRLLGYSPLSRLVELEGLVLGLTGQIELWRSLRESVGGDRRLADFDLNQMAKRTEQLRTRVERLHERAAREALA